LFDEVDTVDGVITNVMVSITIIIFTEYKLTNLLKHPPVFVAGIREATSGCR
jgi:hypothetical protein